MADIELVIKIDEEIYQEAIKSGYSHLYDEEVANAVANGTPLPKEHGRLKDENYFLSILKCEEYETCTWRNCSECNREKCIKERHIVSAPTIIEADKAESEE